MQQHDLRPQTGSRKQTKRVGRGLGSGHGAFSTRGCKGQLARTGKKLKWWFEGGQTPLHRRMPKLRGFKSKTPGIFQVVNLGDLSVFAAGTAVDKAALQSKGLIDRLDEPVKVLGSGDLKVKLTIQVDAISDSAKQKLEAAGGSFTVIAPKKDK